MRRILKVPTHGDSRGNLSVLEDLLPFDVKRIYWVYSIPPGEVRGGHGHRSTMQASVCLAGSCVISVCTRNGNVKNYTLDDPSKCFILYPNEWHSVGSFSEDAVLLNLASSKYDKKDYFYERPRRTRR